jgi:hypothetical protein
MKKLIAFFTATVSIQFSAFTQFSFRVFPMGIIGDAYVDTLLNTRSILAKSGIRQVHTYQTLPEITKSFVSKTAKLRKDGHIEKMTVCFVPSRDNFIFCVDDTVLYDYAGRLIMMKTTDNRGNDYPVSIIDYISEREVKVSSGSVLHPEDSSVNYQNYNENGQLIKLRRTWKGQEMENTSFYYNKDGLLDSTRNTHWGTFMFKRRKRKKTKEVTMNNSIASYKWIYNRSGQCLSSAVIMKDLPNIIRESGYKGDLKTETHYFYNPDGTTESSDKPTFTTYYSYTK